ncbi:excinuclease ABC subunit UvrC [Paradevosia shaoguanensis]|uniref:UvrABC system protein C n=1 Tax=Paradevosia shaoguanensis TaxID=1335043 RepID=A0AA41QPL8_9HYPH|nr:excinuclease ABC subunit UvrC [Paradevosia shaoguanensis]KFL26729.1 excinuclease ABC subunit C [Devosia sp. 17-2-E-8]QMV01148.1 excinuclease ABC subunit UvrC [Devosia sp. D6-9]CDP50188.1 Excinuclease ABC subunit C [Devosia sp. DBB001]MCF1743544.1 excinuclease ABC subunit UvrC [Paradevosia shaoguanensis]MCI0128027.1 excinuclease ABC subunit UvrC [Paradevosia shaoguanensis]
MNDQANHATGPEVIKAFVKTLPSAPGVYRMLDAEGEVIYVGKARSLKARVTNYTRPEGLPVRIQRMISATHTMEFVRTETEAEALLLEANLIKRLRPRFNVALRDDKSFPFILIATDHEAPEILLHRGTRRRPGYYFGPFASAGAVRRTITSLQRAFLLRNCSASFYAARTRPCLQFQIKRCAAPCTREISLPGYAELVEEAKDFLEGKSKAVQARLSDEMNAAAEALDFERAALLRDRLSALALIQSQGDITSNNVEEADIFAIAQEAGQFCVQVFFFRSYQNWGNHAFRPRADASLTEAEVLEAFITQFYDTRTPPKLVLTSHEPTERELIEEALSSRAGSRVYLQTPQRGEKRDLVNYALNNAREALGRQLAEGATQRTLLEGVAELFGLDEAPRRIEVYDNSHISGTNAVGGMIVAGEEGFSKKHYRTFNIKSKDIAPGDDFGMMREVLTRRFSRLAAESEEDAEDDQTGMPDWPDVVFIDGGAGQLNAVREVIAGLNLPKEVTFIGIAKGEERDAGREKFHMEGREPFMLPHRDPVLYYVQRLRDEAHRFAIGTHRARRKKEVVKNPLDEIEGIGPTRKRALLNHFGSAKAVSRAALADLQAIPGISTQMAQTIYDHFNRTE